MVGECNRSNPNQNSKRAVFTALFLCLYYKSTMKFQEVVGGFYLSLINKIAIDRFKEVHHKLKL